MKRAVTLLLCSTLCLTLASISSCRMSHPAADSTLADAIGVPTGTDLSQAASTAGHGMVVFGHNSIYMYHLPMWQGIHAWHIVLEVSLDKVGQTIYQNDRAAGSTLTTINPTPFPLASLAPGSTFVGVLFHGHFEQGGTQLPDANHPQTVTVTVKRLITVKALDPNEPMRTAPLYRAFGHGNEWYASHIPSHNPDFDEVVGLQATQGTVTEAQLAAGFDLTLPGQSNTLDARPQLGATVSGSLDNGDTLPFKVTSVEYFSTSDLGDQ